MKATESYFPGVLIVKSADEILLSSCPFLSAVLFIMKVF